MSKILMIKNLGLEMRMLKKYTLKFGEKLIKLQNYKSSKTFNPNLIV